MKSKPEEACEETWALQLADHPVRLQVGIMNFKSSWININKWKNWNEMIISKINTFKLEASKPKIARVIETKVATWLTELLRVQNFSRLVVPEEGPPQGWWWPWCGICRCRRSRGGTPAWQTPRSSSSSPPCWNSTPRSRPAWAHELLWNNPQATLYRIMIMHFGNIYAYHCHSIFRWPLCKGHVMLMLDLEGSVLGNNLRDHSSIVQILIFLSSPSSKPITICQVSSKCSIDY